MTQAKFIWPGANSAAATPAKPEKSKAGAKPKQELPLGHARLADVVPSAAKMKAALAALPPDMDGLTLHGIGPSRAGPVVPLVRALKPEFAKVTDPKIVPFANLSNSVQRMVEQQRKGEIPAPIVLNTAKLLTPFTLSVKVGQVPASALESETICVLVPLSPDQSPTPGE